MVEDLKEKVSNSLSVDERGYHVLEYTPADVANASPPPHNNALCPGTPGNRQDLPYWRVRREQLASRIHKSRLKPHDSRADPPQRRMHGGRKGELRKTTRSFRNVPPRA